MRNPPHRRRKRYDPLESLLYELNKIGKARLSIISDGKITPHMEAVEQIQKEKHMKAIQDGEVDAYTY